MKQSQKQNLRIPRIIFAHKEELIQYFSQNNDMILEYIEGAVKYAIEKNKKDVVLYECQNVHYQDVIAKFISPKLQWKSLLEKVIERHNLKEQFEKSKEVHDLILKIDTV